MGEPTNATWRLTTAPGVDGALDQILDEIRWAHPAMRLSCGMFAGAKLRMLASRQANGVPSVLEPSVVGSVVRTFVELLSQVGAEFHCASIAADPRFESIREVLFGGTLDATVIVPLHTSGDLVGFIRLDACHASDIHPGAIEALRGAVPSALLAVALERERNRGYAQQRRIIALEDAARATDEARGCEAQ